MSDLLTMLQAALSAPILPGGNRPTDVMEGVKAMVQPSAPMEMHAFDEEGNFDIGRALRGALDFGREASMVASVGPDDLMRGATREGSEELLKKIAKLEDDYIAGTKKPLVGRAETELTDLELTAIENQLDILRSGTKLKPKSKALAHGPGDLSDEAINRAQEFYIINRGGVPRRYLGKKEDAVQSLAKGDALVQHNPNGTVDHLEGMLTGPQTKAIDDIAKLEPPKAKAGGVPEAFEVAEETSTSIDELLKSLGVEVGDDVGKLLR